MSMKDALVASLQHECDIALHLFGQLPPGALAYRPSPGQRSTLELLRYLACCGIGSARWAVEGDLEAYRAEVARVGEFEGSAFPAAMRHQRQALADYLGGLAEEELTTREATLPWGETVPLGRALLEMSLKWMTAYRMQLFLHAKAAGNEDLKTADNWAGRRPTPAS
jgi:hypothetical protein